MNFQNREDLKKQEKDKLITEDDVKAYEKDIQDITDKAIDRIDKIFDEKQKEIMTV